MVKIESGIPVPTTCGRGGLVGFGEAIKSCAVGDSFVWPVDSPGGMASYGVFYGIKIVTRKCPGGRRVWRVA